MVIKHSLRFPRLQGLKTRQSLFLFGARGTGKSTLLKALVSEKDSLWIDLLDYRQESRLSKNPDRLSFMLEGAGAGSGRFKRAVIDEVQKIPKLLDIVHKESGKRTQFIMTGSSARRLKRGKANLLAGRAALFFLYPLACFELRGAFDLKNHLQFGGLPGVLNLKSKKEKLLFLESYAQNYLKEEILQEQIARRAQPFRNFLEMAAQTNGEIVNCSRFAREIGADHKTVQNYFSVLEDTLTGFFLPAYSQSVRKQQQKAPKFFLFDLGLKKALEGSAAFPAKPGSYGFGRAFEHFILLECRALNHYFRKGYKLSYLKTKDGLEIDLAVQRPGKKDLLVEIKSSPEVREEHAKALRLLSGAWPRPVEAQVWSRDPQKQKIGNILCLHWREALKKTFCPAGFKDSQRA